MAWADQLDRATAALAGVALGDAMGMPSQTLSRDEIATAYGRIADFVDPVPDHPVSHGLRAAMVTDDTEQTLLLADVLLASPGRFDDLAWAQALIGWEERIRARGLRDLLGPSSKAALEALMRGVPAQDTGRRGTTNGAAMRVAPVAIATPATDLAALVDRVEQTCRVTHATREAISAAAAVAAVISAGVDGADFATALPLALHAHGMRARGDRWPRLARRHPRTREPDRATERRERSRDARPMREHPHRAMRACRARSSSDRDRRRSDTAPPRRHHPRRDGPLRRARRAR